jgi:hypothetical protein
VEAGVAALQAHQAVVVSLAPLGTERPAMEKMVLAVLPVEVMVLAVLPVGVVVVLQANQGRALPHWGAGAQAHRAVAQAAVALAFSPRVAGPEPPWCPTPRSISVPVPTPHGRAHPISG